MHKHEVTIRPAKAEDALSIAALAHELATSEGRTSYTTESSILEAAFSASPSVRFMVAEHNNFVIGMVMFYEGYDLEHAQKGIHLGDIIVTKTYQKQGIGTKIMHYLAHTVRSEGYHWLSWTVMQSNAAAHQFYKKLGAANIDVQFMAMGASGLDKILLHAEL
jgi:ribosomal protein S18 acetylase RimI-like enzyme